MVKIAASLPAPSNDLGIQQDTEMPGNICLCQPDMRYDLPNGPLAVA